VRLFALLLAAAATPALAQPADPHAGHKMPAPAAPADPHAGHVMPKAEPADPHAGHKMPAPAADAHAGHTMPAAPAADPHAGHVMPKAAPADPHAGHQMPAPAADPHAGHAMPGAPPAAISSAPPPPVPTDHAADRVFSPADMAAARETLRREHGVMRWTTVMVETAEVRPTGHGEGYGWEASASYGGDIHRAVLKTEGDGAEGDLERAEVQALYSRAVGPYFNVQAGVRQDFEPRPRRTYAVLGVEGLAPYWFEVGAAAFLSDKGDLSARLEASYDLRLTQQLILEPRGELTLTASDDRAIGVGSGLTDLELGLRLRYALTPEFGPYVGVNWERKLGDTADLARAANEARSDTRLVLGIRAWF
jgi:copper resistance protein B